MTFYLLFYSFTQLFILCMYIYYYIVEALTQRNNVLMSVTTELLPWEEDVNLTVGPLSQELNYNVRILQHQALS